MARVEDLQYLMKQSSSYGGIPIRQQLTELETRLKNQLAEVQNILAILKKNPDLEKYHKLLLEVL